MLGLLFSGELGPHSSLKSSFESLDITLDPSSASSSIACYASWPLQAYIRFPIRFLSYLTCVDVDLPVVVYDCASSCPVPSTVDPITIKVSGGTVKSFVVDIDPVRRLLCTREAWAREDSSSR